MASDVVLESLIKVFERIAEMPALATKSFKLRLLPLIDYGETVSHASASIYVPPGDFDKE
jgi:hypothetical protein